MKGAVFTYWVRYCPIFYDKGSYLKDWSDYYFKVKI